MENETTGPVSKAIPVPLRAVEGAGFGSPLLTNERVHAPLQRSGRSTEKPQRMDTDNSELRMVHAGRAASVDVKSEVIMTGGHTTEKKESADIKILQRIIAGADDDSYVRVKDDPEKRKLIAEYGYISTQIMANQTAIDDALVYVNAIKDVDEVCAAEHHGQIMELVVSVNQEKE
ncbi:hypothetical protein PC119_g567 [Phytophthora cactorum]|nr:hypothetical protein PC119_g567 [Phytophthora cactorum]KAG3192481.1 hypothetical protein C6341_g646 [Phytophthora cactorum]